MSTIQTLLSKILTAVYGKDVRGSIHDAIEQCYEDVSTAKTLADESVAAAQQATKDANTAADNANDAADAASNVADTVNQAIAAKIDGAYVKDGYLYMTAGGEVVAGPLGPFSGTGGGSGGGSANNAEMSMSNTSGFLAKTIAGGAECLLSATWSSTEDGIATGGGVLTITVGGSVKTTKNVDQGTVSIDVSEYLSAGTQTVRMSISDVYGNVRNISYTITLVSVSISSTFDATRPYSGEIAFTYVPVGAAEKTVYFELDGDIIGTRTVTVSNRQQTFLIPAQSHGSHSLRVWFTARVENDDIPSNELYFDINCITEGATGINIMSPFRKTETEQYRALTIEHQVYDPANMTTNVTYWANGAQVDSGTVDRTVQKWIYRPTEAGELTLEIRCGGATKEFKMDVTESSVQIDAETDGLELYLTSEGRSNITDNPGVWVSGDVEASFSSFNWKTDGWQTDDEGNTVLRVSGDARVDIPAQIFANDFRSTGKTIEIEFASRDVLDYEAMIFSSISDGRGISITAQRADLQSEQTAIGTQYKEDEHVRLTFVTEKRSGNRLILIYLNGIISGIKQYPDSDNFAQSEPVGISIGSNDCTIDIYNIRVYGSDLTRYQVIDNWIADTQDAGKRIDRYERNRIYDDYGNVVKEKLPSTLPYLVLQGDKLPTVKGTKVTLSGYYVDPVNPVKSFVFTAAVADVQGTSSKDYYVKNFKIKFENGFTVNGVNNETYALRSDSIPVNTFTFKADVASSEGANNVELVRLYNDIAPYKTPPQQNNPNVRQGIDGLPIVVFWDNGSEIRFEGKYNFNNDKATEEVFGFSAGDESWEIKNNVSDRVMFKKTDFDDTSASTGWPNDFEARYPEDNTDVSRLSAFAAWVASTDRTAATGNALNPTETYGGVEYATDSAERRLAKFKMELENWCNKTSAQFYWLFTEFFLMVDSRAKNAFPTYFASEGKWYWIPYDMDTAIGINNEGALAFDYGLEDIDYTESGAQVFNGQQSVFWNNIRDAFPDEIRDMYADLRTSGKLTYDDVMARFDNHQNIWPEAIMNEDAYHKYIEPYEVEGSTMYFAMCQGKKELQRTWWLYNRFRYMDAKYDTGDIAADRILIRIYGDANIDLVPYADTYLRAKFGSYSDEIRAKRGQEHTLHCFVDTANDLETTIFPASLITEIADLSQFKIGIADFAKAVKLQRLKIGDGAAGYSNGNLTEVSMGNNKLLRYLDVRNCPNLAQAVDLSGCTNIEEVYFEGSGVTGVSLPNGGMLKTLHLPDTVKNLTLLNQTKLTDFELNNPSALTTLWLEKPAECVDFMSILNAMVAGGRVRLTGLDMDWDSAEDILAFYEDLDTMHGLDEYGENTEKAQISGVFHVNSLTGAQLLEMQTKYPYVTIDYKHITSYLYFWDDTGTTLYGMQEIQDGGDGSYSGTPTKASTAQYTYTFAGGWSLTPGGAISENALKAVKTDRNVYAVFTATLRYYTVYFYNGGTLLQTVSNVPYGGTATYTGSTPTYTGDNAEDYEFSGFSPTGTAITGNTSCYAQYRYTGYVYTQLLDRSISGEYVNETVTSVGPYAFYNCKNLTGVELPAVTSVRNQAFSGCSALTKVDLAVCSSLSDQQIFYQCSKLDAVILRNIEQVCELVTVNTFGFTPVQDKTDAGFVYVPAAMLDGYKTATNWNHNMYVAKFRAIEDYPEVWAKHSWESVNYHIEQGDYADVYAIGDLIPLDMGTEGQINMQIAAFDADDLADGSGKAHISFVALELLKTSQRMNPVLVTNDDGTYQEGTGMIGGWEKCEMRTYMNDTIMPLIPSDVRGMIKSVVKYSRNYNTIGAMEDNVATTDSVWIPSAQETRAANYETAGQEYAELFSAQSLRIKYKNGASAANEWWLRSANSVGNSRSVRSTGSHTNNIASTSQGVCLGFCV